MIEPIEQVNRRIADAAFEKLLKILREQRPETDLSLLETAYAFAVEKHQDQFRQSGEPYIMHPIAVAEILMGLEMDIPTLCASLLHDVVEDTAVTQEEMVKRFGSEVAALVDGVTKLKLVVQDPFSRHTSQEVPETSQE